MPKPKPESFVGYRCRFRTLWEHDILDAKTKSYGVVTFTTPEGPRTVQPDHLEHIEKLSVLPDALVPPLEQPQPEPKPTQPAQVKATIERQADAVREVVRQAAAEVPQGEILTADSVVSPGVAALFKGPPHPGGVPPADLPPCITAPTHLRMHVQLSVYVEDEAGQQPRRWIDIRQDNANTPEARAIVRRALIELSEIE